MKDISGYEKYYAVTEDGKVYSYKSNKYLKPITVNGYLRVYLFKKGKSKAYRIHRLVAETYLPNPDNLPQVDHINEDKTNNHKDNLRWCTNLANSTWFYQNNPTVVAVGNTARSFKLDGKICPSIAQATKLIMATRAGTKKDTIRKELRRFLNSGRSHATLYGFLIEPL